MQAPAQMPIFDGHNDTILRLYRNPHGGERTFFEHGTEGHVDLPRARAGGLGGGFFAICVPPDPSAPVPIGSDLTLTEAGYEMRLPAQLAQDYAYRETQAVLARLLRLVAASAGAVRIVRSADDLAACLRDGTFAVVPHLEGADAIDQDLDALEVLAAAGVRSLGIVWSRPNVFGHGVPFAFPASPDTGPGLTDAGRALVLACNSLGVLVDLAHLNEQGFWDVAGLSDAPLVVTHAGVHALCPITRNVTDTQLDAIRESGGLVGITYAVSMVRPDGRLERDTPLEVIVRHVAYVADRIGIEHVALGSDFDGAIMPAALADAAALPQLLEALRAHGFDEPALRRIAYENWLRVLRATWKPR